MKTLIKAKEVLKNINKDNLSIITKGLYQIFLGMVGALLIFMLLNKGTHSNEPKIYVVDVVNIVNEFIKTQSQLNLPQEELHKRVRSFSDNLERSLERIAIEQPQVILLPRQAVLSGGIDITADIKKGLPSAQQPQAQKVEEKQ